MKILVVGGTGTIGKQVVKELGRRHELIAAGFDDGDEQVDITNKKSIEQLFERIGPLDAVIATVGKVCFAPLAAMNDEKYGIGLKDKLLGQVNLVLLGIKHLNDKGSFTLTSGVLNVDPIVEGSSAAMVNGALEGFVKAVALELPRYIRINCVSPTIVAESMDQYEPFFRGYVPVPAALAAKAYSKSVEGMQTGQVYKVGH